jgi:hypothetical protein
MLIGIALSMDDLKRQRCMLLAAYQWAKDPCIMLGSVGRVQPSKRWC